MPLLLWDMTLPPRRTVLTWSVGEKVMLENMFSIPAPFEGLIPFHLLRNTSYFFLLFLHI